MRLITVIPIAKGIAKDTLSYFSANQIQPGSLIKVPIRSRTIDAIVINTEDARDAKSEIRGRSFSMKKIGEFKTEKFLPDFFMEASRKCASYHASSIGSLFNLLLPKIILESPASLPELHDSVKKTALPSFQKLLLQSDEDERFGIYRSLIREEFAKHKSIFFVVPTAEDAKQTFNFLSKGIEKYSFVLHPHQTKKNYLQTTNDIKSINHPTVIVATPSYFSHCSQNVSTIIVENESSRFYKLPNRPFVDGRIFASLLAKELDARIIFGDTLLRVETIWKMHQGEYSELTPLKFRKLSTGNSILVNMAKSESETGKIETAKKFETIGKELENYIDQTQKNNGHLFIYSARRGLGGQTVCSDCGEVASCSKCLTPISLHKIQTEKGFNNIFNCHICGEKREVDARCAYCLSWKLKTLGVGSELVEEEIKRKFPNLSVFRIDKDATPTAVKAKNESAKFYTSPGSVLIGTETALPFLDKKVDVGAIASLDSLFSIPDFKANERIMQILLKIRSLTLSTFIIQTRKADQKIIDYAIKGNLIDFYRDEIASRENFNYPPFKTLIKISLSGTRARVQKEIEKLDSYFSPFETETFPAFAESARGLFTMHLLIRLNSGTWVEKDLLQKILSLPPEFRVEVEPESLL